MPASDPRPAVGAELVMTVTFDLREIDEVIEIVDHLPNPLDHSEYPRSLREAIGGAEVSLWTWSARLFPNARAN